MKKFGIFGCFLALVLICCTESFAVTLPSTSYQSYDPDGMYNPSEMGGIKLGVNSHSMLREGVIGPIQSECTSTWTRDNDPTGTKCSQCCSQKLEELCGGDLDNCTDAQIADADACSDACDSIPLPISTPLWFVLILSLLGGFLKQLLSHKKDL